MFGWQIVEGLTANGRCAIRVRVHPLPQPLAAALEDCEGMLSRVLADNRGKARQTSL